MTAFRQTVCTFVQDAQCVDDLLNLITYLPLQKIKDIIIAETKEMDDDKVREMFMKTCPMDYILSRDCVQSILSFVPDQSTVKLVNKNFNKLNRKIEQLASRGLPSIFDDWETREKIAKTKIERKTKEIAELKQNYRVTISKLQNEIIRRNEEVIKFVENDIENVMRKDENREKDFRYCRECHGLWHRSNMPTGCEPCNKPLCDDHCVCCSYGAEHATCEPVHLCEACSHEILELTPCYTYACKDCMKHHDAHCQEPDCVGD